MRYIGARYVPLILGEWDNKSSYEPLSVVLYQGNSYTSKKNVPVGVDITNTTYWVQTGNYNQQIEQMYTEWENYKDVVDDTLDGFNDTLKSYAITPDMFNATGDGITDDTEALREAIHYSHEHGNILFLPPDKKYLVSDNLNHYNDADYNCKLNIQGCNPTKHGEYTLSKYGGIIIENGASLFKNKTITGSIKNLSIIGKSRNINITVFNKCEAKRLTVYGCNISNVGVVFRDTSLLSTSLFDSNILLTAYYFAKNETGAYSCIDSMITNNYINGGAELNDNAFSEWVNYNGSLIQGNFIDYYQTIYRPKAITDTYFHDFVSQGNQYQVFRYFYFFDYTNNHILMNSSEFDSIGDVFNWTNVSTLDKLQQYTKYTYTDKDGNTVEYPPYIFGYMGDAQRIRIKDAIIQSNVAMSDLVVIRKMSAAYSTSIAEFSCNLNPVSINAITFLPAASGNYGNNYNYGAYMLKLNKIDVILTVTTLPTFAHDWCTAFNGMKVIYQNKIYTATNFFDGSAWQCKWLDEFNNPPA